MRCTCPVDCICCTNLCIACCCARSHHILAHPHTPSRTHFGLPALATCSVLTTTTTTTTTLPLPPPPLPPCAQQPPSSSFPHITTSHTPPPPPSLRFEASCDFFLLFFFLVLLVASSFSSFFSFNTISVNRALLFLRLLRFLPTTTPFSRPSAPSPPLSRLKTTTLLQPPRTPLPDQRLRVVFSATAIQLVRLLFYRLPRAARSPHFPRRSPSRPFLRGPLASPGQATSTTTTSCSNPRYHTLCRARTRSWTFCPPSSHRLSLASLSR